jgi:hypothetical protein
MITLKQNKIAYDIPTTWNDVTIKQFNAIMKFIKQIEDAEDYPDELIYSTLFIIFTEFDRETYFDLSVENGLKFRSSIEFILNEKIKDVPFDKHIFVADKVIKIKNFENFSFSEFVDIQHLASANKDEDLIKMVALMSDVYEKKNIFKLKFKDKKLKYTMEQKVNLINNMKANKYKAILSFFLSGQKQYTNNMVSSLKALAKRIAIKAYLQMVGHIMSGLWMRVKKTLRKWTKR